MARKLINILNDNKDFAIASLTYIAANIIDSSLTVSNVQGNEEGNPIINYCISHFGKDNEVIIPKIILVGGVLILTKAIDNRTTIKYLTGKNLLYSGSVLTTLAGLSWLVL